MSDEGEKSCPLCAEEMDLTDQQLRPCKCGYEICVWCWHHIMDMAEKDETEGRCPACRTPYNKEKIVGTTAKCERLVSEITAEKKLKSQKGKSKISEGRKQLGSARVIQRNLVYVVGLPLSFADEDLLQRREYFGQYGKVLKVSISRTATGAIQQFANVTCSVYITYSKEEEAVRCIQLVHGFTLDGRPLRACFGTTKYCHAWLRNMPCTNPDCLYLHEIGSQEDSFTKDEVISAHTRSRIQQVTGSSNSMHRRSGNVLPPPEDEFCNNSSTSSAKPVFKTPINTNNSTVSVRTSPPNSSSGRSAALPAGASWGTRQSSNQPPLIPNGPPNQRIDTCSNGPMAFSKAIPSQPFSLQIDTGKKKVNNEERTISPEKSKTETCVPVKKELDADGSIASQLHSPPRTTKSLLEASNIVDSSATSSGVKSTDRIDNVCSNILSLSIEENQNSQNDNIHHIIEPSISQAEEVKNTIDVGPVVSAQPDPVNNVDLPELDDDLLSFHKQRIKDPEIASTRAPDFSDALNRKHSDFKSPAFDNTDGLFSTGFDRPVVDTNTNSMGSNLENIFNNGMEDSRLFPRNDKPSPVRRYETEVGMGESSIISNILSMDFEPWDEPLTSPQNLAKFLGETDRPQGSFGAPGPRKTQNSNQSRFSFAREEEDMSHRQSTNYHEQALKQHLFGNNFSSSSRLHSEKSVSTNGLPFSSGMEQDYFTGNNSHFSSNKLPVSRPQVSAPPGFSAPSRAAAPPGFSSHGRNDPIFEPHSGNHTLNTSYLSRNQYHISSNGDNYTNGDIEFMDPAILAVGKGTFASGINNSGLETRPNYPQFNTYDESRFQSMLQRSIHIPPQHNQRFSDLGDSLSNNMSPFSQFNFHHSRNGITSNGQWDGWNEAQSMNNLGVAELLRNERLGFSNKFYSGYEESKMRMPGSGNIYNGAYGI